MINDLSKLLLTNFLPIHQFHNSLITAPQTRASDLPEHTDNKRTKLTHPNCIYRCNCGLNLSGGSLRPRPDAVMSQQVFRPGFAALTRGVFQLV